jgi:hypothetical protein
MVNDERKNAEALREKAFSILEEARVLCPPGDEFLAGKAWGLAYFLHDGFRYINLKSSPGSDLRKSNEIQLDHLLDHGITDYLYVPVYEGGTKTVSFKSNGEKIKIVKQMREDEISPLTRSNEEFLNTEETGRINIYWNGDDVFETTYEIGLKNKEIQVKWGDYTDDDNRALFKFRISRSNQDVKNIRLNKAWVNALGSFLDTYKEARELVEVFWEQSRGRKKWKIDLGDYANSAGLERSNEEKPPKPIPRHYEGMLLSHYLLSKGWKTEWFDATGRIARVGTSISGSLSGDNNCNFYERFNSGFLSFKKLWHRELFHDGITQIKVMEKQRQGSSIFIDQLEVNEWGDEFKYGEWYIYRLADLSDRFTLEHSERPHERFSFFIGGLTYVDSLYIK